jgi:hypothetical protein
VTNRIRRSTAIASLIKHPNSAAPLVKLTVTGCGQRTLTLTEVDALIEHHKDAQTSDVYLTLVAIREHANDLYPAAG